MQLVELLPILVTVIGVFSFAALFTILYQSYANAQIEEIKSGKKDIEIIDEVIYERKEEVRKKKRKINIIKNIIYYTILCIVVPLFVFSLINKINNNVLMINDKSMIVVASNSMSFKHESNKYLVENNLNNQFSQYDIIILERVKNVSELKPYDVICFKNDKGINIIHRIKEIENGKEITFLTRGDSNNGDDKYHPKFDDVIGRYTGVRIKGVGIFIMFLQSYAGIITIVSLVYCLIMIDRNSEKINKIQMKRASQLEQVIDYSKETSGINIKAKYQEVIYYKGYAYTFDENGLIEKKEIEDKLHQVQSQDKIIKEVINEETKNVSSEKIVIKETEGD